MSYKSIDDINVVCVTGAGTMGHGIAQVAAMAEYDVSLQDIDTDQLQTAMDEIKGSLERLVEADALEAGAVESVSSRIETFEELDAAAGNADFVIEAVPERIELKRKVFEQLEESTDPGTVLATNTSSFRVTEIAETQTSPERVIGLHWFNPPVKMELVEVVSGDYSDDEAVELGRELVESFDKTPIVCRKDIHQFIVNNVLDGFLFEAMYVVSRGDASIREVDAAMVADGWPMGPFELADFAGLDVLFDIREEQNAVPPILAEKYEAGTYGRKTGAGFYDYEDGNGVDYEGTPADAFDSLTLTATTINEGAWLVHDDVTSAEEVDLGAKLGLNAPWGPFEHVAELGIETVVERLEELYEAHGVDRYEPCPLLTDSDNPVWERY